MFYFILSIHVLLCLILIGLVLLQQGKGADLGAAMGGGSNTVFGASGATAFVVKATTISAILFMITSIMLVKHYRSIVVAEGTVADRLEGSLLKGAVEQAQQPQAESTVFAPITAETAASGAGAVDVQKVEVPAPVAVAPEVVQPEAVSPSTDSSAPSAESSAVDAASSSSAKEQ